MNKIYKIVWSHTMQTWVVVSELCRSKGKTKSKRILSAAVLAAVSGIALVGSAEGATAVNQAGEGRDGSSVAFGIQSNASHDAVAVGGESKARSWEDVAIGYKAVAGSPTKKVDGKEVHHSSEQSSVAVGTNAQAPVVSTTAIGAHANALGEFSTAVGAGARAENLILLRLVKEQWQQLTIQPQ